MHKNSDKKGSSQTIEAIVRSISIILVLATWAFVIYNFSTLPAQIPVHFDSAGQPDNYGRKEMIFILPVIGTALIFWISGFSGALKYLNIPMQETKWFISTQYSRQLMNSLGLVLAIIFFILVLKTHEVAEDNSKTLGKWFLPLVLVLIFTPTVFFLIKSRRNIQH